MYVEAKITLVPPIDADERFDEVATSAFILFMIKEIAISSYGVVKCILTMKKYNSKIVEINVPKGISLGKTLLLSSSITLTPGTSVVLIEDGKIYIHCFKGDDDSIQDGQFVRKVLSFNF